MQNLLQSGTICDYCHYAKFLCMRNWSQYVTVDSICGIIGYYACEIYHYHRSSLHKAIVLHFYVKNNIECDGKRIKQPPPGASALLFQPIKPGFEACHITCRHDIIYAKRHAPAYHQFACVQNTTVYAVNIGCRLLSDGEGVYFSHMELEIQSTLRYSDHPL